MINPVTHSQMFDTLTFSKNMQKVGMTQPISDELACNIRYLHVNQFENLLTKEEFKKFEKEIGKEIQGIKIDVEEIKNEVKTEIGKIRTEFKNEISEIRTEFKNQISEIRTEFKNEISEIRTEFKNEIENLVTKKEFYSKIKNLELTLTVRMGVIMAMGIGILDLLIRLH